MRNSQVLTRIANLNNNSLAVIRIPKPCVLHSEMKRVLVLSRSLDHGSVGTLLRTCAAFFDSVCFTNDKIDPFHPKVVRASQGALWSMPYCFISKSQLTDFGLKHKFATLSLVDSVPSIVDCNYMKSHALGRGFFLIIGPDGIGVNGSQMFSGDLKKGPLAIRTSSAIFDIFSQL